MPTLQYNNVARKTLQNYKTSFYWQQILSNHKIVLKSTFFMNLINYLIEKLVFPHFLYPNDHLTFIIFSSGGNEKRSNLFQSVANSSTTSLR